MIYYVEDDTNIRELTLYALRKAGLEAKGFSSGESFLIACAEEAPDLILLDIMLPGIDGLELLDLIRRDRVISHVPVMMLTAKGTEYDTVRGLDAGADDYLAKPFGMMELVSRCNALLRRAGAASRCSDELLECGPVSLRAETHEAYVGDMLVELTPKEFELLRMLLSSQGRVLSRTRILEEVWGLSFAGETRTVDTHVQTLRRKLNEASAGAGDLIKTIRGVGYCIRLES